MWLVWLSACGFLAKTGDLKADLEKACDVAAKVDKENVPPKAKLEKLAQRLVEAKVGPAGIALVAAVRKAPPAAREKVVNQILKQNGLSGLECEPLEAILLK